MLGAINNTTKDFRIKGVLSRNEDALKKFITVYKPICSNVSTDGCSNLAMNDSTDCAITNGYNNNDPNDIVVAVAYEKSYEFPYIATGSIRGNQFIGNHYGAKYKCYIIDGQALCE